MKHLKWYSGCALMREVSLKNKLKNQKLGVKVFSYTFTSVSNI